MIELIDNDTNKKIMAMIFCGICYQEYCYLIYLIQRNKDEVNIFVSKLYKGSMGYLINNNFDNGEKEVLDNLVKRLLNKENKELLASNGFNIMDSFDMDSNLMFDIDKCYVSTVPKSLIKECLLFYGLKTKNEVNKPVIEVIDDDKKLNEGFASNIFLIIVGTSILIISLVVIFNIIFK